MRARRRAEQPKVVAMGTKRTPQLVRILGQVHAAGWMQQHGLRVPLLFSLTTWRRKKHLIHVGLVKGRLRAVSPEASALPFQPDTPQTITLIIQMHCLGWTP